MTTERLGVYECINPQDVAITTTDLVSYRRARRRRDPLNSAVLPSSLRKRDGMNYRTPLKTGALAKTGPKLLANNCVRYSSYEKSTYTRGGVWEASQAVVQEILKPCFRHKRRRAYHGREHSLYSSFDSRKPRQSSALRLETFSHTQTSPIRRGLDLYNSHL